MKPLSLYIHFPFCIKKCNYCDFLSFPTSDDIESPQRMITYIQDLKKEILSKSHIFKNYSVVSIFFGGGTPSLMTGELMKDLLFTIKSSFHIDMQAEITCECNPGTLNKDKLQLFYDSGINRLSIGLQSACDDELRMLGRIHQYDQFLENYLMARSIGFKNINIDLMSALPGQSFSTYINTLKKVLSLNPEHISAYSLIIEEGTPFYESLPAKLPSEDEERKMYHFTRQLLIHHGFERYEISNYAKAGFECRHNTAYWIRQDYLGLGLGSSSLIDNHRFTNPTDLSIYHRTCSQGFDNIINEEYLDIKAQMEEFMFLGLRLTKGISVLNFENQFKRKIADVYGDIIKKHLKDQTLDLNGDALKLTEKGLDVANYVMSDFIL